MTTDDVSAAPSGSPIPDLSLEQRLLALEAENTALRAAHTRFDAAPAALLALDRGGLILAVNLHGCALLGMAAERLRGRSLAQLLSDASRRTYTHLLRRAGAAPAPRSAELEFTGEGGEVVLYALVSVGLHGSGEYLVTLVDFGPHRDAHLTLLREREALEQQVQTYAQGLRSQGDEFDEIVQALSGEVHTAIGRSLGFLDLLHRDVGDQGETAEQHFAAARRSLEGACALIVSLRGYARANRSPVRLREVDLNRVLREVEKDLYGQMVGREVRLTRLPLPVVQGDSQALQIVFTELLSNALKFTGTREEARIHVLVHDAGDEVHLGVQDNGVGFNMRHRDALFRIFRRLHPSGTFEGAGVGLAVVRRVCARFGGRVWAEGQPDKGATFWVAWPKRPVVLA